MCLEISRAAVEGDMLDFRRQYRNPNAQHTKYSSRRTLKQRSVIFSYTIVGFFMYMVPMVVFFVETGVPFQD